jgi:glycine cleavage system H protein
MKVDANARYTRSHEWVRQEDGLWTYGITDHAQESLSDIVYVELPGAGDHFSQGAALGALESVKAASDLLMPVEGTVRVANEELSGTPEVINTDPFGQGWLLKIEPANPGDWDRLLSPADYEALCGAEGK